MTRLLSRMGIGWGGRLLADAAASPEGLAACEAEPTLADLETADVEIAEGRDLEEERREEMVRFARRRELLGVGGLSDLDVTMLEALGVDSVLELAMHDPAELRARMAWLCKDLHLTGPVPSLCRVRGIVLRAALRAGACES